jgi:starvation-inducible DNA-binding protein
MSQSTVVEALKTILADQYALYLKTQNYHWNVVGPQFAMLHTLFEGQYQDLAEAIDTTAELIRGLGIKAPASLEFYAQNTKIKSGNEENNAEQMLKDLLSDQLLIQKNLKSVLEVAAASGDDVVVDFMIQRLTVHRKAAWMLQSCLA